MGKRALLLKILQDIRASYWFLPMVLAFCGLALAVVMGWLDRNPSFIPLTLPDSLTNTQADGARSMLSVIAQSILGIAGVTFSMTLVAVSFASGNFGPRLIDNFMRDRGTQLSLGILIATFVYALAVLRTVQDRTDGGVSQFVPHYSILMALVLTLVCVLTLIYFIHHVPEMINVSRIAASIGAKLNAHVTKLIEEKGPEVEELLPPNRAPDDVMLANTSGYIQTVNFSQLSSLASDMGWHIRLASNVGDFVTPRSRVFEIWRQDVSMLAEKHDDEALRACYAVGISRTEHQNPTFLAEQLVEMIARALSPGVNDPYTAMDCLNRLTAALTIGSTHEGGLRETDKHGERITSTCFSFEQFFAATFPLCRQYVEGDVMVSNHAVCLLTELASVARQQDRPVIEAEIRALRGEPSLDELVVE